MAIKLIGADLSGTANAAKLPQAAPISELTPTNGFQFAGQQLAQAGQGMQSSIQSQAKLTSAMAQDNAQTTEAIRVSQQTQIQANAARGADNLKGLADVGNLIVKTLDDVAKRKAAERKAQQDANAAMIDEKLTKWELTSIEKARTDPGGIVGLATDLEGLFGPDADITQDDRAKLMKRGYGHLAGIQTKNVEDRVTLAGKVRTEMDGTTVARAGMMNAGLLTELTNATDADTRASVLARIMDSNKDLLSGKMSPLTTALVQRDLAENMRVATTKGLSTESEEYKALQNMQEYSKEALQAQQTITDPLEYKRYMGMLGVKYKVPNEFASSYDLNAGKKLAVELAGLDGALEDRQNKLDTVAADAEPNSTFELGALVNRFFTENDLDIFLRDPSNTKYVVGGKPTSHGLMLRKAFDIIRKGTKEETAENLALADDQIKKARLGRDAVEANISYLGKLKPETAASGAAELRNTLASLPGIDATKSTSILNLLNNVPQNDPAKFAQWQAELGTQYGALQASIREQSDALDKSAGIRLGTINKIKEERARYGFVDGVFDSKGFDKYIEARKREAALRQPVPGVAGTPANFSRTAMATIASPTTGKQIYVPFRKDTQFSIGAGLGDGRNHKGLDLPAEVGTPIISPMRGKVIVNEYQSGGAGNYIAIQYEDGTEHAYFHMPNRSTLKVGQPVVAGQQVGAVGNTGRSSGPHLHWEVRNRNGDVMDPYAWAEQYSNTPQRGQLPQHRSVETSFKTRQNPPGTTAIFGGYIQGSGPNTKVIYYDKPTQPKPVGYTTANPLRNTSDSRRPGGGGLDADHGYKALKDDPVFRRALNETSKRLGFNGQWLADAMAGESGFSPSIRHNQGEPAVGMIQFFEDPGTPGYKTVNGKKYSLDSIGRMGRIEQLKLVENYFTEAFRNAGGKAKSPEDVLGLIWANKLDKDIPLGKSDGYITWEKYRQTLGRQVGRKYSSAPPRADNMNIASTVKSDRSSRVTQVVDSSFRKGCTVCTNLVAVGQFVPHERVNTLNKGSELFTYG